MARSAYEKGGKMIGDADRLQALAGTFESGDYDASLALAKDYVNMYPEDTEARYILAASFVRTGQNDAARAEIRRIYRDVPGHPGAGMEEAYILKNEGRVISETEHLKSYTKRLREILKEPGLPAVYRRYIRKSLAEAESLLGSVYARTGLPREAVEAFLRSAAEEAHEASRIAEYSNALFAANCLPSEERAAVTETLIDGYTALLAQLGCVPAALDALRQKLGRQAGRDDRRIRVGYVSPDLREHPVAAFLMPLLTHYNRDEFRVCCYANNREDRVSAEMKLHVDVWRNVAGESPMAMAETILADGIDILVDLAGHTARNLLPVFAMKPAPVQLTGIGYFNTTGLAEMDYMLGDMTLDPVLDADGRAPGMTERALRLSKSHFCYHPLSPFPEVSESPSRRNGCITFGSFNNFNKVNDEVLRCWAGILHEVEGSRLLLKGRLFQSEEGRALTLARMEAAGLEKSRVELRPPSGDYLREYGDIDIALDPFPYTGGITTCEALCMGVPVVSLAGSSHGSRFSMSLLCNADLAELVAKDTREYAALAVMLAGDAELRTELRRMLRTKLKASPVMDEAAYVKEVEGLYKGIVRKR